MKNDIFSKGFGLIPKSVMLNTSLSVESKAIFAYLASFTDKKGYAFPALETILDHLQINKSTYYKHLKPLVQLELIKIHKVRSSSCFGRNTYQVYDDYSSGYGRIPKAAMVDKQLPIKSKGLYAYLCVFAGNKNHAFPRQDVIKHHLGLGRCAYYRAYNALQDNDYITSIQRQINGKITSNEYFINKSPNPSAGTHKGKKITVHENPKVPPSFHGAYPKPKNQIADSQVADPQIADFWEAKNNNPTSNRFKDYQSLSSSASGNPNPQKSKDEEEIIKKLKDAIEYEKFKLSTYAENVDEILAVMKFAICSKQKYLRINRSMIPHVVVAKKLWSLGHAEIRHAINNVNKANTLVFNRFLYLLTVLYNTPAIKTSREAGASYDLRELEKLVG